MRFACVFVELSYKSMSGRLFYLTDTYRISPTLQWLSVLDATTGSSRSMSSPFQSWFSPISTQSSSVTTSTPLFITTTMLIRIWYDESATTSSLVFLDFSHQTHLDLIRCLLPSTLVSGSPLPSSVCDTMGFRPSKILESSCNSISPLSYLPLQGSSSSKSLILRVRLHLYHMCKREGLYTTILCKMPEC